MIGEFDWSRVRALDTETAKIVPGRSVPPIVLGSTAHVEPNGSIGGALLVGADRAAAALREFLVGKYVIVTANGAYDMVVIAKHAPDLLALIFRAYRERLIYDVSIIHTLDAIFGGHMGVDPRTGGPLVNPATGKPSDRYALATVLDLVCGRTDAKEAAAWRTSYELCRGYPVTSLAPDAAKYPVDDTCNTFEAFAGQMRGWRRGMLEPGVDGPARNFENSYFQAEAAFCLNLQSAWSFRTDPQKVEALAAKVEQQHAAAVERFQKRGWRRPAIDPETGKPDPDAGKEDSAKVRRAVAEAYGAVGQCKRCRGSGKVRSSKMVACRGEKVRGRYKGCPIIESAGAAVAERIAGAWSGAAPRPSGVWCFVCLGKGEVQKLGNPIICKNVYDDSDETIEHGCDGSGLDLSTAPLLPRSQNKDHPRRLGAVSTGRDTLMESGDEELAAYGDDEFEKTRTTFIRYLREGTTGPLTLKPNVLVATGRISYEGSPFHQFPRDGGARECIRARGAWCGHATEMVLGSTDYSAGELCALGQFTYWLFGKSAMRDAINKSRDPGILHSELAAEVMGLSLDDFLARLKAKDKTALSYRQASKPKNFGGPAKMGSPKIVLTNRKKNAGFTVCEGGPAVNSKGEPGYWGIRFCVLIGGQRQCGVEKITRWTPTGKEEHAYDCQPVCKKCVEIEAYVLTPSYLKRFPEISEYHYWAKKMSKDGKRAPSAVWDASIGRPRIIRERAGCELSAFANNGFQGLLADIGKDAYITITRECYLGVKDDGSPSPLAGCRAPVFMHDEPITELILRTAHLSGPRVSEIMVASGQKFAPDVFWKADTALAFWLNKGMEPVHAKSTGQLIPWGPIPEYLRDQIAA